MLKVVKAVPRFIAFCLKFQPINKQYLKLACKFKYIFCAARVVTTTIEEYAIVNFSLGSQWNCRSKQN